MEIAVVTEGVTDFWISAQPCIHYKDALADKGIHIQIYSGDGAAFQRRFDAMLLLVWQDWKNRHRFIASRILPLMARYAIYRAEYPDTIQIIVNHTDMARRPYATPYWRPGDPVLYRTPAYDRAELYPFPADTIWPYELIWGAPCFASSAAPAYRAGFIGTSSRPRGYRERVAAATAKVGIGVCTPQRAYAKAEYDRVMAACRIIVCPRGWGEQSSRHWEAWLSGKPVLTDRDCDSVEMIPGVRLQDGVHYLVFDSPEQIPEIVTEWTHPSRHDALARIAENGRRAALSYDGYARMAAFFEQTVRS